MRDAALIYLNNRHYDPTTGVFVSVDPLVTTTMQPYLFGAANPATYSDPSGLCPDAGCWEMLGSVVRELAGDAAPGHTRQRQLELNESISESIFSNLGGSFRNGDAMYSNADRDYASQLKCDVATICGPSRGIPWDDLREITQIAATVGSFTPCSVYCASVAAGLATYDAVDTCSSHGMGTECGISSGAAALSWVGPTAHVIAKGSRAAAAVAGSSSRAAGRGGSAITARPLLPDIASQPAQFLKSLPTFVRESPSFWLHASEMRLASFAASSATVAERVARVDAGVTALLVSWDR